jgi:hypothetical protein
MIVVLSDQVYLLFKNIVNTFFTRHDSIMNLWLVTGVIGSLQALEVIKILSGMKSKKNNQDLPHIRIMMMYFIYL